MTSANILVITQGTKQPGLGIQACSAVVSWHLCVYRAHSFYFAPNSNKIKQDPVFTEHRRSPKTEGGREGGEKKAFPAQKRLCAPVNDFLGLQGQPERER